MPAIPTALAEYVFAGLKSHDLDRIAATFRNDIVFVTPVRTMHRDEILAFLGALYRGFPDWNYDHDRSRFSTTAVSR